MNKYELCVVLSAKLEDDERTAVLEKVQKLITRFGGTIENIDEWGTKKLAYDYFIHFDAEATAPVEIENRIRIMDNVIRYLCVRADA